MSIYTTINTFFGVRTPSLLRGEPMNWRDEAIYGKVTGILRATYKNFWVTEPDSTLTTFVTDGVIVTTLESGPQKLVTKYPCLVKCQERVLYKLDTRADNYYYVLKCFPVSYVLPVNC